MGNMEDYKEVYKTLSRIALKMAVERGTLDGEAVRQLKSILGGKEDEQ